MAAVGRAAAPLALPALAQRTQQGLAELAACMQAGKLCFIDPCVPARLHRDKLGVCAGAALLVVAKSGYLH